MRSIDKEMISRLNKLERNEWFKSLLQEIDYMQNMIELPRFVECFNKANDSIVDYPLYL
jgi:hypothetical protein